MYRQDAPQRARGQDASAQDGRRIAAALQWPLTVWGELRFPFPAGLVFKIYNDIPRLPGTIHPEKGLS